MSEGQKLIDVIEKEAMIVDSLINIMKQKQEAIIALTLENLQSAISEELKLVSMTKSLEKQRIDLIKKMIPDEEDPESITLSEIINKSSKREGEKLSILKDRLRISLDEIKRMNDVNTLLILRGKNFIKENISILTGFGEYQLVDTKI